MNGTTQDGLRTINVQQVYTDLIERFLLFHGKQQMKIVNALPKLDIAL